MGHQLLNWCYIIGYMNIWITLYMDMTMPAIKAGLS